MRPADSGGLEALYRLHRAELLRMLIARTHDTAEAEEILQEIWIRLPQATSAPIANGRAYLFRMAQNLIVDRLREKQRRMRRERIWLDDLAGGAGNTGERADTSLNAEELIVNREETARLASALETLPDGARRAFELHKMEGMSHAEVAIRLGISRSGVEKHMAVAMKYLRRALLD